MARPLWLVALTWRLLYSRCYGRLETLTRTSLSNLQLLESKRIWLWSPFLRGLDHKIAAKRLFEAVSHQPLVAVVVLASRLSASRL